MLKPAATSIPATKLYHGSCALTFPRWVHISLQSCILDIKWTMSREPHVRLELGEVWDLVWSSPIPGGLCHARMGNQAVGPQRLKFGTKDHIHLGGYRVPLVQHHYPWGQVPKRQGPGNIHNSAFLQKFYRTKIDGPVGTYFIDRLTCWQTLLERQ